MTNDEVIQLRSHLNQLGLQQWSQSGLNLIQQALFTEHIGIAQAEQGLLIRTSDSLSAIARMLANAQTLPSDLEAEVALAMNRLSLICAVRKAKALPSLASPLAAQSAPHT